MTEPAPLTTEAALLYPFLRSSVESLRIARDHMTTTFEVEAATELLDRMDELGLRVCGLALWARPFTLRAGQL